VYWSSFRTQVPLFLSNPQTAAAVAELLPRDYPTRLLDLGSGTGALLRPRPPAPRLPLRGHRSGPAPYLLSRLLSRRQPNIALARGDFWKLPWADYDLVYAFLSPVPMAEVWRKATEELRPGSLLVSNSFPVEGITPTR
jgi:SAM-dependent methyltransferase